MVDWQLTKRTNPKFFHKIPETTTNPNESQKELETTNKNVQIQTKSMYVQSKEEVQQKCGENIWSTEEGKQLSDKNNLDKKLHWVWGMCN